MMTETYEQITARERDVEARRQRAWEIHQWEKNRDTVKRAVDNATKILSVPDPVITTLSQISALVATLPAGIPAQPARFISGGFELRDLLIHFVSSALSRFEAKREQLKAQLAENKVTLDQLERTLVAASKG